MKNFISAFAAVCVAVVITGCCCSNEVVTAVLPDAETYIAVAGNTTAAASAAEKDYDWQIYPAYVQAVEDNDAVKLAAVIDSEGVMIWNFVRAEEDFARLADFASEFKASFLAVKDAVDADGSAVSTGIVENGEGRAYTFTKIAEASRIPGDEAVGDQYLVLMVSFVPPAN